MSEWRPEGWENLYSIAYESHKDTLPSLAVQFGMQGLAYEDGANAMLAALREMGPRVGTPPTVTCVIISDEE